MGVIFKIISIVFIIAGIGLDVTDFVTRMTSYLKREKVSSPNILAGFLLQVWGLHCLIVLSNPRNMFKWLPWKYFLIFSGLALLLHLIIHIVLPLIVMIVCNIYYGRHFWDLSDLPPLYKSSSDLKDNK